MAEGASNALAPAMPVLFSRQVQPAYICLPSLNAEFGMRSAECLMVQRAIPHSTLRTSHSDGCQGWTRTNTERLNRPPCYFDTTWQWLIGAAGRSCTCIGSFRRRMPRLFRPRQRKSWIAGLVDCWIHGEKLKNPIIHSSTNPFRKWSARQDLHLRSLGPKPSVLLLHYALLAPASSRCRSRRNARLQPW